MVVNYSFFLGGKEINAPVNWSGLQILATFDQSSTQANISTEEFEFINESAQQIRNYLMGGLTSATNGIFEGIPFEILVSNGSTSYQVFEGFLDFETYEELSPVKVKCSVKKTNGLNSLDDRSQANSFGYLEDEGFIKNSDYTSVPYLVEKLDIEGDVAIITVTLFMLAFNLKQVITELKKDISLIGSIAASGITGLPASLIYAVASALLNLAMAIFLVVEMVKLITKLFGLYLPPQKYHKGMTLRKLMEKASEYLGYNFISPITELDKVVYLPSSPQDGSSIEKGIPNASDFGYSLSEIFQLCNDLFNSKIVLLGNDLHLRNLDDAFWIKNSTYKMPSILDEKIKYNNADFSARTFLSFRTDIADDWTTDDFRGTNYEVITTPITETDRNKNLMRGLNDVSIPCALGSRKSLLSELEESLLSLASLGDSVSSTLNSILPKVKKTNFVGLISGRVGSLRVSQKVHTVPKLIYLENGKIPIRDRDLWSAKVLWDKYHVYNSFVSNDFNGQRRIYEERRIPFGFTDFLKTIDNSYFTTADGKRGKIESLKWELDGDFAVVSYWVQEVYTKNLKEKFIEG